MTTRFLDPMAIATQGKFALSLISLEDLKDQVDEPQNLSYKILSPEDKSRVKFHLGFSTYAGIYEQDVKRLEQACSDIESIHTHQRIVNQLDRCDLAYAQTNMLDDPASKKRLYAGDLNRARVDFDLTDSYKQWNEVYMSECHKLSIILWVPNYRDKVIRESRRDRNEPVYIQEVEGPADNTIISNLDALDLLSGGCGF